MSLLDFSIRIVVALLFGSAIGVERQWRQRRAGLRTNALVASGAAAFVTVSTMVQHESSPTRIASYVVSGIGFLGAGVILREGQNIRGLNTAATLWCSAAAGVLAGWGFIANGAVITAVVIGCNVLLRPLARLIDRQPVDTSETEYQYRLKLVCRSKDETHIRALLLQMVSSQPLTLKSLHSEDVDSFNKLEVTANLVSIGKNDPLLEQIVSRLSLEPGVSAVSWEIVAEESS